MRRLTPEPGVVINDASWALIRWALGLAQIVGATLGLLLFVMVGDSKLALVAAIGTTVLTGLSRFLFRP